MRSEISHVHPEIRTQIPDEIMDCNQVSFSAPFADNHLNQLFIYDFTNCFWHHYQVSYKDDCCCPGCVPVLNEKPCKSLTINSL